MLAHRLLPQGERYNSHSFQAGIDKVSPSKHHTRKRKAGKLSKGKILEKTIPSLLYMHVFKRDIPLAAQIYEKLF